MIRSFESRSPRIHRSAFVHDAAEIIGDVAVGENASVWPMAVLRGDVGSVRIGAQSNIQDCAVVHCRKEHPTRLGRGVTVGHGAVVHGARIGDFCLIGMGAVVMEADIGRECLIAAGAVVTPGLKIPPRSLVLGLPAKSVRRLTSTELKSLRQSAATYAALARRHRDASHVQF
ncbi:MAG: gamma carbonic anhydrase family protein [Elusimicrobia bacterium]|nr:gamma carbonic anhydrase family protein [Elusimicrobiota bacterium]